MSSNLLHDIGPDPHFGCCVLMVAFKCKIYVGPKLLQDTVDSVNYFQV